MPEAQIKPASPPSRRAELVGELGRVGMAVARVNESTGLTAIESVDVVEIGRAIDRAELERGDQRGLVDRLGSARGHRPWKHVEPNRLDDMSSSFGRSRQVKQAISTIGINDATEGAGPRCLAKETGCLAEQGDDLGDLAERNPSILGGTCVGGLASQAGQSGPVERPGLRDRLLLDVAGQLVEPIDQGLVDRTFVRFDKDGLRPGRTRRCAVAPSPASRGASASRRRRRGRRSFFSARLLMERFGRVRIDPLADANDQNGDIVEPPAQVGEIDQVAAGVSGVKVGRERADFPVVDRAGETVGAEEIHVAELDGERAFDVDLDFRPRGPGSG